MKAGRELDALVAEKVMGMKLDAAAGWNHPSLVQGTPLKIIPPKYSTDIAAAWQVVQNLRERGWYFDIGDKPSDYEDMASPRVWSAFVDRVIFGADADTPMEAICLVALKSVGALE